MSARDVCNAFHSGCGFGSAITQRRSQFVVDSALSLLLFLVDYNYCLCASVFSTGAKMDSILCVAIQMHKLSLSFSSAALKLDE